MPWVAGAVLYYLTLQAAGGAQQALTGVLDMLSRNTSINIEGTNWLLDQFGLIKTMAVWVMLPLIVIAITHAVAKGSMQLLVRSALVYPAVALLGTMVAVRIISLLLGISDDFSQVFFASVQKDMDPFFEQVKWSLEVNREDVSRQLIVFLLSFLLMLGGLVTLLMLIVREASIFLATAFLPLGFAMLVWPQTVKYFRRMVDFLLGMIFAKVLMAATLAIAVASLTAAGTLQTGNPNNLDVNGDIITGSTAAGGGFVPWLMTLLIGCGLLYATAAMPFFAIQAVGTFGLDPDAAGAVQSQIGTRPSFRKQYFAVRRQKNTAQIATGVGSPPINRAPIDGTI